MQLNKDWVNRNTVLKGSDDQRTAVHNFNRQSKKGGIKRVPTVKAYEESDVCGGGVRIPTSEAEAGAQIIPVITYDNRQNSMEVSRELRLFSAGAPASGVGHIGMVDVTAHIPANTVSPTNSVAVTLDPETLKQLSTPVNGERQTNISKSASAPITITTESKGRSKKKKASSVAVTDKACLISLSTLLGRINVIVYELIVTEDAVILVQQLSATNYTPQPDMQQGCTIRPEQNNITNTEYKVLIPGINYVHNGFRYDVCIRSV